MEPDLLFLAIDLVFVTVFLQLVLISNEVPGSSTKRWPCQLQKQYDTFGAFLYTVIIPGG